MFVKKINMKNIITLLFTFFLVSQFLTSCKSSNNTLSSFSKRKYLKRRKPIKLKMKQTDAVYTLKKEPSIEKENTYTKFTIAEELVNPNNLSLSLLEKKDAFF